MHKPIQKRFFDLITAKEPLFKFQGNPINTYKELIHYRFKEVVLSAFPRFMPYLSEYELNDLVEAFIKTKPETPFIWQMPNEFRAFLAKNEELVSRFAFMNELLWFEWIEIEIFMRPFEKNEVSNFVWDSGLKPSDSTLISTLEYPVYDDSRITEKGEHFVLLYYNFETHQVHYQELTPFLHSFLQQQQTTLCRRFYKN